MDNEASQQVVDFLAQLVRLNGTMKELFSSGNVALFTALFPVLGFAAGILTRWYVNASLFVYLITCFVSFLITAAAQIAGPALAGNPLAPMLWTGLVQSVWSLPMAAAVYYPCRAIGRKKI